MPPERCPDSQKRTCFVSYYDQRLKPLPYYAYINRQSIQIYTRRSGFVLLKITLQR